MELKDVLDKLANTIVDDAKKNAPVLTGKLKNSITSNTSITDINNFNITISELGYGKFVNNGTKNQKSNPFLDSSINNNLNKGIAAISDSITNELLGKLKEHTDGNN